MYIFNCFVKPYLNHNTFCICTIITDIFLYCNQGIFKVKIVTGWLGSSVVECSHGHQKALGSSPIWATIFHLLHMFLLQCSFNCYLFIQTVAFMLQLLSNRLLCCSLALHSFISLTYSLVLHYSCSDVAGWNTGQDHTQCKQSCWVMMMVMSGQLIMVSLLIMSVCIVWPEVNWVGKGRLR